MKLPEQDVHWEESDETIAATVASGERDLIQNTYLMQRVNVYNISTGLTTWLGALGTFSSCVTPLNELLIRC